MWNTSAHYKNAGNNHCNRWYGEYPRFRIIILQNNMAEAPSSSSTTDSESLWSYELLEAVEMVVRGHLHVSSVSAQSSDKDHSKEIPKEALHSRYILEQWEEIADNIPSKYEEYSIDLLSAIVTLWTTVIESLSFLPHATRWRKYQRCKNSMLHFPNSFSIFSS